MRDDVRFWGGVFFGMGIATEAIGPKLVCYAIAFAAGLYLLRPAQ